MKTYSYEINGRQYEVTVENINKETATVVVNGESYQIKLKQPEEPKRAIVVRPKASVPAVIPSAKKYSVKAPLPGVILEITVKEGDEIKRGDTVAILDAMKMENNIVSDRSGKVASVCVTPGESVMEGTDLIVFE